MKDINLDYLKKLKVIVIASALVLSGCDTDTDGTLYSPSGKSSLSNK